MAEINLIKAVIEEKTSKRKESSRTASVIVFVVLLFIVITVLIVGGRFFLLQQNRDLDSQVADAENQVKEGEEIQNNINSLNSDYAKIKAIDKTSRDWAEIFAKIAAATPADIQITKIDFVGTTTAAKKTTQENKVKITGDAGTRKAIALLQEKLQLENQIFSSVDITRAGITTSNDVSKINFEIEAILKKPNL